MDELSRHERFMQLFMPAQQGLYGYVRTLIPNPSDADDVLQAAATVMWQKFDDFRPDTRFEHWAYSICRLQALRHLKEQKRSKLVLRDDVLMVLAERAVAISQSTAEVIDALEVCVEQLPERDRDLLRMRFEPGATNRSVAQALGYSEMRVSRALNRTYGDLLQCIQGRVVFEKSKEDR
jgi:RNA polymerase sigma-70 factor, ECF subfamily